MEVIPSSQNIAQDLTVFKNPPAGLNVSPPGEYRVDVVCEGLSAFQVAEGVGRTGPRQPLFDLDRTVGGGKQPAYPGIVANLEMEVVVQDLLEIRILDGVEIPEDVDPPFALPMG